MRREEPRHVTASPCPRRAVGTASPCASHRGSRPPALPAEQDPRQRTPARLTARALHCPVNVCPPLGRPPLFLVGLAGLAAVHVRVQVQLGPGAPASVVRCGRAFRVPTGAAASAGLRGHGAAVRRLTPSAGAGAKRRFSTCGGRRMRR